MQKIIIKKVEKSIKIAVIRSEFIVAIHLFMRIIQLDGHVIKVKP